eukprot:TRINITY_DN13652_c0_g2_i1.p1 TRINITY_DN13652_c0_g2~~TRINITY_DN13652_c0_g2_i1.p1  ORF type:complete len:415 (+),score=123.87 TRINITY_DN13652_c0_g2_i1:38-1246(+)
MDKDTLHTHLSDLMSWRLANTPDTKLGGYYEITDDPSHNHAKKTLVNTCRGVFCLAVGAEVLKDEACVKGVQHGLAMLDNLADKKHGGYYWEIDVVTGEVPMREKLLYGHAFVLLATSQACKAGIVPPADVTAIWDLIEAKYWKEDENAYSDLTSEDWSTTDPYRGQNGVMHLCEALISAYKATGTKLYLQKASLIATKLCKDLPDRAGCNMVWEHYTSEWNHDWDYNRTDLEEWTNDDADPTKMGIKEYRPWGYLPGHVAEWAKLLLLLALVEGEEGWYVERAAVMMRDVMKHGWDEADGGLYYCLSPEKALEPMNDGKFMWPLAEGLAAARLLASYPAYKEEFGPTASKIWTYSEKHFIKGSTWLSRLTKDNTRLCVGYNVRDLYHPLAACYDLLKVLYD